MKRKTKIPEEWLTHFEKSGMLESPDYESTIAYFKKFEQQSSYVNIQHLGFTPEGRDLRVIVVSKDKAFLPVEARKTKKPVVLIQNGIHPGEIEGKDACMLLLREVLITKEKEHLLDNLILLIIPVLNADGHERLSPFNRPNQNGPKKMGWRTNSLNLNLNRDYTKADSSEIRGLLKLFDEWVPDFMIDNHSTNGADYQYHVTYGIETHQNIDEGLSNWIKTKYLPYLIENVEKDGFLTAPYIEFMNGTIESGIKNWFALPRLSHGYCAAQNRVCLLVETHSLKPFENRVYSTKSMMLHTLEYINNNHEEIITLNRSADRETQNKYIKNKRPFPVLLSGTEISEPFKFKAFKWTDEHSEITGSAVRHYSNEPVDIEIPLYDDVEVLSFVRVPFAYLIPKQFNNIIELLKLHHIKFFKRRNEATTLAETYKFEDVSFYPFPYEGRQLVKFKTVPLVKDFYIPSGTILVPANQRQIRLIVNLLEPESPDSFVSWGFFNAFFERKEYAESYVMEPFARKMLEDNPKLKESFIKKLESDESFRNNPSERLDYFYRQSPFYDKGEKIYPILRIFKPLEN